MIIKAKKIKRGSFQDVFLFSFFGLLTLLIISFLIFSNWRIQQKRSELKSQIKILKKEIERLEKEKKELLSNISQINAREYLEKIATEKFNLKPPGSKVVVIKKEKEEKKEKEKESFWQKILEKLKF
jgi:cell division protein FtsL